MTDARTLFDAADAAAATRNTRWWAPQPPVLWLTSPAVTVGEKTWRARHRRHRDGQTEYGFTPRQCMQIRGALLPVLALYGTPLESIARHVC